MLETVQAGFPSPASQYAETALDLNDLLVPHPAATYFVRVSGDSMTGAGILPGDILIVDRTLEAVNGSTIVANVDGEFTVKHLRRDKNGIRLEPANRKYRPIILSDGMELQLFGVVSGVVRQVASQKRL